MHLLELAGETLGQQIVEVVAAQAVVAVAGENLGDLAFHQNNGHIEGAAAQIVDERGVGATVAVAIGEAGGRGLVQDADNFQSGQGPGFARGVALGVGEIRGDGDDGLRRPAPKRLRRPFGQFAEDESGDFRCRELLAAKRNLVWQTHAPLDAQDGPFGVKDLLVAGGFAHQKLAGKGESDAGRQDAFIAWSQDPHLPIMKRGDLGVRGA